MIVKLQSKIYLKDWLILKPYQKQAPTDIYYLKVCNKVKQALENSRLSSILATYLPAKTINEELNMLACFLTSYFEDLISETNLWLAFTEKHLEMYGKPLPFYDTTEYCEGEINQQDISFLMWYFINCVQEENYIEAVNEIFENTAEKVMDVLDAEWETAPENEVLQAYYYIDEYQENYYAVKQFIEVILFDSYLYYPDTGLKLALKEQSLEEENAENENFKIYVYDNMTNYVHSARTQLLSLSGKEWAAAILGEHHQLSEALLSMSERLTGLFLYKGQDEEYIHIEHIASSKKFAVTKQSMEQAHLLKTVDTIVFMGIVQWKNEWWFSGAMFQQPFNADIVLDQKNSDISRKAVNFLDTSGTAEEHVQTYLDHFLQFNKGNQIAFMPVDQIDGFINDFFEYHNNALQLTKKQREEIYGQTRKDGYFKKNLKSTYFSENYKDNTESGLVFLNPKSGLEMAIGLNSAFPLPNNPFYNIQESEECIFSLLEDRQFSKELVMFCIEHCKDDLLFFNNNGLGKRYLKDTDFLLRFWKAETYHSKPNVTLIDNNKGVS